LHRHSLLIAPVLAISLAACNNERPEHTSDWYARNPREAQIRQDKCEMLSLAEQTQECVNSAAGQMTAQMRTRATVNPWK
jgi:hypothetical protein